MAENPGVRVVLGPTKRFTVNTSQYNRAARHVPGWPSSTVSQLAKWLFPDGPAQLFPGCPAQLSTSDASHAQLVACLGSSQGDDDGSCKFQWDQSSRAVRTFGFWGVGWRTRSGLNTHGQATMERAHPNPPQCSEGSQYAPQAVLRSAPDP